MKKSDYLKPLEECSKEIEEGFDVSEYDTMQAILQLPDEFSDEQLHDAINNVLIYKELSSLIEKGLVEALWDEGKGDMVYRIKQS